MPTAEHVACTAMWSIVAISIVAVIIIGLGFAVGLPRD